MNRVIIDVREANEFENGHFDDAINIPLSVIQSSDKVGKIPKNAKIIVYCNSGNRSQVAKNILESVGYSDVTNGINQSSLKD